ncbi:MAG: ABC transporter permease [Candidatus Hodarchaeota archaeon]
MKYIFKHSFQILTRRKRNFLLTAFVIALGISLVVQTQILGDTIERNYKEVIVGAYGNKDIVVYAIEDIYFEQSVSDALIWNLRFDFQGIFPQIAFYTTIYFEDKGQFEQRVILETLGDDFDSNYWGKIKSDTTGEELDIASLPIDEIVVSPELADSLGAGIGAQLRISLLDEQGNPIFQDVTVKDIYAYEGYGTVGDPTDLRRIFMGNQAVQSLIATNLTRPITQIWFGINDHKEPFLGRERSDKAADLIADALNRLALRGPYGVATVRENNREGLEEGISGFIDTFNMFGIVVILAGLLLITNIQLMNMEERERQIGMLRAIGAKKRDIIASYSIETLLSGAMGGIFGLFIGMGISFWLNDLTRKWLGSYGNPDMKRSIFDIVINPGTLLTSLLFAITLSVITGMVPALRTRKISIIEIVRGNKAKSANSLANNKKPLWPLFLGGIFLILGSITLIELIQSGHPFFSPEGYRDLEAEATDNLYGLALLGIGIIFASFRLTQRRRLGLSIGGLLMICITVWGFEFAVEWVEEGGSANSVALIGLLCLVIGATTIVGANLELLTGLLRKTLSLSKATRATGLVATRFMNSRKTRAVLTFATFAVILSLNFFAGSYAHSQTSGSRHTWEDYFTRIPMVVESQTPVDLSTLDYPAILQGQFEEIKRAYPLATGGVLPYIGPKNLINPGNDIFYSKVIALNSSTFQDTDGHPLYPFMFENLLPDYTQLSVIERLKNREALREEAIVFWKAFLAGQKIHRETLKPVAPDDPNGLPMFFGDRLYFMDLGEIVSFPTRDGDYIEMIYAAAAWYFPSTNLHINEYTRGVILSTEIAAQIDILGYGVREFLIEPTHGFDYDKNEALCGQIEEFSNKAGPDSLLTLTNGTMYGITAHNLWDIVYHDLAANAQGLNFLQLFISTGLVIGVLGLLIVSHRSVKERKREIGMLRSLGFSKKAISLAVLLELLFLGVLGFMVGFVTGNYLGYAFARILGWNLMIPWVQVSLYGIFIMGAVFLAAIIPGWLAARIPPSDALRYSG